MQFALIGSTENSTRIVRAIRQSPEHVVSRIHNADHHRELLFDLAPRANWDDDWESLLVQGEVDAVIMTVHDNALVFEDQLRKLTQAAVPLIVVHPIHDSLLAYEIQMMREEAGGIILPYVRGSGHPAWSELAEILRVDDSAIGKAEQVLFDRHLPSRDRETVRAALGNDITLVRQLIGDIRSINAIGGEGEAAFANLSVNLTGTSDLLARWSVTPESGDCTATIKVVGAKGQVVVNAHEPHGQWRIRIDGTTSNERTYPAWDDGLAVIEGLQRALGGVRSHAGDWEGICHDLEVAEQTQRSLKRKRTVELRRDSQNEEGNFKGIMSAGSCLLLMLALLLLFAFAVVEGFRMPLIDAEALRAQGDVERGSLWWRLWPVYPLVAFLLLQLLVFVAKQPKQTPTDQNRR